MLQGNKTLEDTGAVGHPLAKARVMNVLPLQDREVVFDGTNVEVSGTASWAVLGNDTINLTTDAEHRIGVESMEFDKTDGAANTKNAGVARTAGLELDASRFLLDGVVSVGIQVSSLADVAKVHLRLGTDSTDYQSWSWNDAELVAGAWNDLHARIDAGVVNGNGWNPASIKYAAFFVEFDAETDALADILVDYVMITQDAPGGALLNGVNLSSVTAATNGAAVDASRTDEVTVYVEVSGNTGAVTVNIEHSPDGSAWYPLDSKTYTATNTKDDWSYHSHFPWMRTTTTVHANATVKTTITGKVG
jgi:hypothetical protein